MIVIHVLPHSPFYGYHESEEPFLKIYLYNPTLIRRWALRELAQYPCEVGSKCLRRDCHPEMQQFCKYK